jgi:hypothetical protein
MLQVELTPDLDHCIETLARKEHISTVNQLLASVKDQKKLSEKVEILRIFLETADFRKLRSDSEKHLKDGKDVKFVIYLENGALRFKMQVN